MPVFISQEANNLPNYLCLGGEALGGQYVSYVDNTNVNFGIYQIGDRIVQRSISAPGVTSTFGLSMSANGGQFGRHQMVVNVSQPVSGSGEAENLMLKNGTVIPNATSLSGSAIASSLDTLNGVSQVSAIAWIGENPPPPGDNPPFQYRYYGNVNIATDYGSPENYSVAPVNNDGVPNAYSAIGPRIAFRNRTLYFGYVGTDNRNMFNLWSSTEASQYQAFVPHNTPIYAQLPSLGVQGSKLVVAWIEANSAIHMGYWNGEPTDGGFDWQDVLMRHIPGGPDQPVSGTPPLMSQSGNRLLLSWKDVQHNFSTALVTLP